MAVKGKVSVVIPCYNHGHFLGQALESLEKSTYPHIEVVVVDDGSTSSDTYEHIDKLRGIKVKGNTVRFVSQHNQGLPATRNNGVRMTDGEYILALDADDMVAQTYIEKAVWVLTKYPNISIVYPSIQHFGTQDDIWHPRPYDYSALLHDNYIAAGSVYRRKVWEDVDGYDVTMKSYEDWDFWIRAGAAGHTGYWIPEPLFYYRKSEMSMLVWAHQRRKELIRFIRTKNKEIYRKWYRPPIRGKRNIFQGVSLSLRRRLSPLKWKFFVLYVKLAQAFPQDVRDKGRRFVKPLIRGIFRYAETRNGGALVTEEPIVECADEYCPNKCYLQWMTGATPEQETLSILFFLPWMKVGGVDKVHLDLAEQMVARGYQVHIFTTAESEHPWYSRFLKVTPHITQLGNWFKHVDRMVDYTIDYIRAHRVQIVQISNSQIGYELAGVLRRQCADVKIVDLLHSESPQEPWDYFRFSTKFRKYLDHRVVLTQSQKRAMERRYGESADRVSVIHNGVHVPSSYEQTNYPKKMQGSDFVIGFVGRFSHEKQPLAFIRVARNIVKVEPRIRFVMIGDGPEFSQAERMIASLRLGSHIELYGQRDDVWDIMQSKIQLLIGPSLYEGLPIVGLEAFANGIPIVATSVSGWVDLVRHGETGYLAPVGHEEEMASFCLDLYSDSAKRLRFSKTAYDVARRSYSIEETVDKYLGLYRDLLHVHVST
ncbi:MAG: glycosyltransferase [Alicyclobacillus sp.]|nr:glycosyltransferase [Alicyclobacillus sp.]